MELLWEFTWDEKGEVGNLKRCTLKDGQGRERQVCCTEHQGLIFLFAERKPQAENMFTLSRPHS